MTMEDNTLHLTDQFFAADQLIKEGKIAEAMQVLTDIIAEDPAFGRAHNHLGWIYETKYQDYNRAEQHYKAAMQFSPEYMASYYNYAYLLSTMQRHEELTKHLDKALKIPGINLSTIYCEYGVMYELQGKLDEAIKAYKESIKYTLDTKEIERISGFIERCKQKKNIFSEGGLLKRLFGKS